VFYVIILHVKLAAEEGLGVADPGEIEVRGKRIAEVSRRFVPYQEAARGRFGAATIIENNACTGCMGEMVSTFVYLNTAGFYAHLWRVRSPSADVAYFEIYMRN